MSDKELVMDLLKKLPADAELTDISKEIEIPCSSRTGQKGIQIVDFKIVWTRPKVGRR